MATSARFDSNEKDFNYNPSHNALEVNDSTRALSRPRMMKFEENQSCCLIQSLQMPRVTTDPDSSDDDSGGFKIFPQ